MWFSYEQGNNLKHNVASKHRRQEYFLNFQSVFYFPFFPLFFLMKMKKTHGRINPPQKYCDYIFAGEGDVLLDEIYVG